MLPRPRLNQHKLQHNHQLNQCSGKSRRNLPDLLLNIHSLGPQAVTANQADMGQEALMHLVVHLMRANNLRMADIPLGHHLEHSAPGFLPSTQ